MTRILVITPSAYPPEHRDGYEVLVLTGRPRRGRPPDDEGVRRELVT